MAQWARIHPPAQGTWVPSLVWEEPTCRRETKPEPTTAKAHALEPVLHSKRSHGDEKPEHCDEEQPPLNARTGQQRPNAASK